MSALSLFASFPWSAIFSTGVVGIAVGAWLNHVLAARREAAKDARERERDRERDERDRQRDLDREDRERQREQKREKEARDRERGIVDAELLESLRSHCGELRPWLIQMNPQTPGWYAANQDLLSRADNDRVRSALGEQYLDLMSAIRYETKSVWIQRKCKMRLSPRYLTQTKSVYHTPILEEKHFRANSLQNVADVLAHYAPLIVAFGDPQYGEEVRHAAETSHARAIRMLNHDPTRR